MRKMTLAVVALGVASGLMVPAAAKEFKMTTFVPQGTVTWKLYPEAFTN